MPLDHLLYPPCKSTLSNMAAEAALSAFLQVVFQNAASPILEELASRWGIDVELRKLRRTLSRIQAVLNDAERRQIREEAVRIWLSDLKDMAYFADDLLDEFRTVCLRSELELEDPTNDNLVTNLFSSLSLKLSHLNVGTKINEIRERLDEIAKESNDLCLRDSVGGGQMLVTKESRQTTSYLKETHVCGRDYDKEKLIRLLLSMGSDGDNICVIPLVGMGGLGKTTVAQLVYNDQRVEGHFNSKMWVCVSEDFDANRITKAIIESISKKRCDLEFLDTMQQCLRELLNNKRFLVVLDDVWNESCADWEMLRVPLLVGARGSKVIITTRSMAVGEMMGTMPCYRLGGLSDHHCWLLFCHRAFGGKNINEHPNLERMSREMIKKCKGSPLAAKSLGGLMRSKHHEYEWQTILDSEICELQDEKNDILPVLRLSYRHLPAHLKQCFAYCAVFPKKIRFCKDHLVRLWMAQGFVQEKRGVRIEDTGADYFDDLFQRSFFESSSFGFREGGHSDYMMHDLIHNLAQSISGEECLREEDGKFDNESKKARHASFSQYTLEPEVLQTIYQSKGLRTFLLLGGDSGLFVQNIPQELFNRLICLRVLDLRHCRTTELPDSIGSLVHLRYLGLFDTPIESLPKSISGLYNLQTLDLGECYMLKELPQGTRKLINLRHLDLHLNQDDTAGFWDLTCTKPRALRNQNHLSESSLVYVDSTDHTSSSAIMPLGETVSSRRQSRHSQTRRSELVAMPPGIGKLINLQTLPRFVVGGRTTNKSGIEELKNLKNLRGDLCILKLENVIGAEVGREANLKNKQYLTGLEFCWGCSATLGHEMIQVNLLENLQPHTNLRELVIRGYGGFRFPSWMSVPLLSNLVAVRLVNCSECKLLPALGNLPVLNNLFIGEMDGVTNVGRDFCGDASMGSSRRAFASLRMLSFQNMPNFEMWSEGEFPCLSELQVMNCPKLVRLPPSLPSLTKLEASRCTRLTIRCTALPSLHSLVLHHCSSKILLGQSLEEQQHTQQHLAELPPRLARLQISSFSNLSSLPGELIDFKHLEDLEIEDCPDLAYLTREMRKMASLERLEIWNCPKLCRLPYSGLPASLQFLSINQCPILKARCQDFGSREWHMIAGTLWVWIDGEALHDQPNNKNSGAGEASTSRRSAATMVVTTTLEDCREVVMRMTGRPKKSSSNAYFLSHIQEDSRHALVLDYTIFTSPGSRSSGLSSHTGYITNPNNSGFRFVVEDVISRNDGSVLHYGYLEGSGVEGYSLLETGQELCLHASGQGSEEGVEDMEVEVGPSVGFRTDQGEASTSGGSIW